MPMRRSRQSQALSHRPTGAGARLLDGDTDASLGEASSPTCSAPPRRSSPSWSRWARLELVTSSTRAGSPNTSAPSPTTSATSSSSCKRALRSSANPTRAIAWLKTYPRDGADVTGVQAVAAQARSLGVARHALPTGMLVAAAFVSDRRRSSRPASDGRPPCGTQSRAGPWRTSRSPAMRPPLASRPTATWPPS